jgi:hypothetical protein
MMTRSLLHKAFVALSLGAFLISPAQASQDDAPNNSSTPPKTPLSSHSQNIESLPRLYKSLYPPLIFQDFFLLHLPVQDAATLSGTCKKAAKAFRSPEITKRLDIVRFLYRLQEPILDPFTGKKSAQASPVVQEMLEGPMGNLKLIPTIFKEGLEFLRLDNYTGALPKGAFNDLGNLGNLDLNNYTGTLPAGIFSNLRGLEALGLNSYTGTLPVGFFSALEKLNILSLNSYTSPSLPVGIFSDLESLKTLFLNSYTGTLPVGIFSDLENLKTLSLNDYTDVLPAAFFASLRHFKILSLSGYTGPLPAGIFASLRNLKILHLNSYTGTLPEDFFANLPESLECLFLRGTTISYPADFAVLEKRGVRVF